MKTAQQMCFPKYSLCETYRQGSSEISFIHLNIDNSSYACYSSVKVLLSINTLLEPRRSNYSLKKICFQISRESRLEDPEIFWGRKISPLLLMTHPGKQLRRYVMTNLISRDLIINPFQGMIR